MVIVGLRFNPPPGWPPAPPGFVPPPGWQPDPGWPPVPPGWQLWIDDGQQPGAAWWPDYDQQPAQVWERPAVVTAGTSGLAVASLVLGLLGFTLISAILAIVFGVLALRRIRSTLQRGRGLAIAGIVLSGAWIVLIGGSIAVSAIDHQAPVVPKAASSATPSPTGSSVSGSSVSVFSLVTGNCFDNPTSAASAHVSLVVQTSCSEKHNAQIFATFKLKGSIFSYPGTARIGRLATRGCNARIKASLNPSKVTASITIRFLFPLEGAWLAGGRTVQCMIFDPTGTLTSSVMRP
jgi:hypothetical protein